MIDHQALLMLGIGLLMLAIGGRTLLDRSWRDGIPAIDLAALRLLGRAPAPRTAGDQRIVLFNACACTALGALLTLGGLAAVLTRSAE